MADLIHHTKVFNENFCIYNASRPQHPNTQSAQIDSPDDPSVNFTMPSINKFKKLIKEQKAYCQKNSLCMYCGTKGHFQDKCPKKSNPSCSNPGSHTCATDMVEDSTPYFDPSEEAPKVAHLYHESLFQHFDLPKDHKGAQDF